MRTLGFIIPTLLLSASAAAAQVPLAIATQSDAFGPKNIVPALVACTDLPAVTEPTSTQRIVAPHASDFHQTASRGDLVVLNGGTPEGYAIGQRYYTRRLQPPVSRDPIGTTHRGSIRTSGWLTVVAADERFALGRIDYACTAIEAGDYLEPYAEVTLPSPGSTDGRTNFSDLARVLFGVDRRASFGAGDFLSIDRGTAQGVVNGARVTFYRDRANGTPLFEVGTGIVVDVTADAAKVAVDRASEAVKMGDYVGFRVQ